MAYRKIKPHKLSLQELKDIWNNEYCNPNNPIYTHDGILVKFYSDMFKHAFYESADNKMRDKSILSLNRLEKIYWIKDTLMDSSAILKQGWDRDRKTYNPSRRVAFIKNNYVVIISINRQQTQARFITAYEIQDDDNSAKIMKSPDWKPLKNKKR